MTAQPQRTPLTPLEAAILRTVLYADVFDFPMTVEEIHHFLIHAEAVTCAQVEASTHSLIMRGRVITEGGFVACAGRGDLIERRIARQLASQTLWPLAVRYGIWLGRLPFVRMVAMTGALAMRNAGSETDDLDYLIVTASNRVWLARLLAVALVRLVKLRGTIICPNYVLAGDALEQDRKDLFIAHEIAQMIPLCNHTVYWQFREANRWASAELPNAHAPYYQEPDYAPEHGWQALKRLLEHLLSGKIGDRLERWEYRRKLARFAADMRLPTSAAQIDERHIKGHFNDYGGPVLRKYHQRLREHGLEDTPQPMPMPGD